MIYLPTVQELCSTDDSILQESGGELVQNTQVENLTASSRKQRGKDKDKMKKKLMISMIVSLMILLGACIQAVATGFEATAGTFTELKNAINAGKQRIILTGTEYLFTESISIPTNGNVTLVNDAGVVQDVVFKRDSNYDVVLFNVQSEGTLSLGEEGTDIALTLDGENRTVTSSLIRTAGALVINGAELINNNMDTLVVWNNPDSALTADGEDAIITLNCGKISGNNNNFGTGGVRLNNGASMVMKGGEISGNTSGWYSRAGGVQAESGASFTMEGGLVKNNEGGIGGVLVGRGLHEDFYDASSRKPLNKAEWENKKQSTFTMTGGAIDGNEGTYFAGGVMVSGNAKFTMNNGTIQNNTNVMDAGGVLAKDWMIWQYAGYSNANDDYPEYLDGTKIPVEEWSNMFPAAFEMNGGIIANNKALGNQGDGDGGGLLVQSNKVVLEAGVFRDNQAKKHGGAIHVKTVPYALNLKNLSVYGNHSDVEGGGLWICPIGDAKVVVNDGAVLYGNTAEKAGDDFFTTNKHPDFFLQANPDANPKHGIMVLPERLPNGTPIQWCKDGKPVDWEESGHVNVYGPRYKPGDEPVTPEYFETEPQAFKAIVDETVVGKLAQGTKLKIFGNTAGEGGGGIGSNGFLVLGDVPKEGTPIKTIVLKKVWNNVTPTDITINALIDGQVIKTLQLTKDNNYTVSMGNLPVSIDGKPIEECLTFEEPGKPEYIRFTIGDFIEGDIIKETYMSDGYGAVYHLVQNQQVAVNVSNEYDGILRIPLKVNKVLKNGKLKGGEFTFQMKDKQGKVIAEATNAADGTIVFPDRAFSKEVVGWIYTVHEVPGNNSHIIYDKTVYTVRVTTKAVNGQLKATVNLEKNGIPYDGVITFTNDQKMPSTGDHTYQVVALLLAMALLLTGRAYMFNRKGKE